MLEVGAKFKGQASRSTLNVKCTSEYLAKVLCSLPLMPIIWIPRRFIIGRIARISAVSPEFEMAIIRSLALIMPRSPWLASPGCKKNAGVPVLAMVAAILEPIWPDLPMPVTTILPVHLRMRFTASVKSSLIYFFRHCRASISASITPMPVFL